MRPPRVQRGALRYPLDVALGSAAAVRLVRVVLHEVGGPVSVADAARLAGLSANGTRRAFEVLEDTGIVARVGTGRALKYGPRQDNPYATLLGELFEQEEREYAELLGALGATVAMPEIRIAWVREVPKDSRRTLELDVVAETKAIGWVGPELRSRMLRVEKRFDMLIEVNVFTRADDPDMPDAAVILWGTTDSAVGENGPAVTSFVQSEERSTRMAQTIAELVRVDPSLVRRALRHVNSLLREGQGTADADIGEWRQLLETYSAERLSDLLVSDTSRAQRLRRSSPFFAVLTPEERDRVLDEAESRR